MMIQSKTAFITGINGQDGSYLAEFLLSKYYKVVGLIRRTSTTNLSNISHLLDKIILVYGDIVDQGCLDGVMLEYKPDEVYNLAAMSFVPTSWKSPVYTMDVNAIGPLKLLESIKFHNPKAKFYQAGTSEQFGKAIQIPQNEDTPFYPRSPYGVSKCSAYWTTKNYRESYNLFACTGIAFNHESPRRGIEFVTRKITNGVARISLGLEKELGLGNIAAKRDWSFAGDIVKAMWMMLQQDEPDDYVIGSGETHSIKEFCYHAFNHVGLSYNDYVFKNLKYFRPAEVDILISNPTKIKTKLGWESEHSFEDIVKMMVEHDLEEVKNENRQT